MSTFIAPFVGSGISVFNSFVVIFFTIASASLCTSSMLVKFEESSSEHPGKNALHPMPQRKGFGLEFMMDKGKEVVTPLDKGKEVVPPLVEVHAGARTP
ncbi:hypothetical protein D1007_32180 [Hordeum vulgare]|nr:hypothetical protein D1007_32180 [Hordeum vulgare]